MMSLLAHEYASKCSDYCWCHLFDAYMCICWHWYKHLVVYCGIGIDWRLSLRSEWWTVAYYGRWYCLVGRMQQLLVLYKHRSISIDGWIYCKDDYVKSNQQKTKWLLCIRWFPVSLWTVEADFMVEMKICTYLSNFFVRRYLQIEKFER